MSVRTHSNAFLIGVTFATLSLFAASNVGVYRIAKQAKLELDDHKMFTEAVVATTLRFQGKATTGHQFAEFVDQQIAERILARSPTREWVVHEVLFVCAQIAWVMLTMGLLIRCIDTHLVGAPPQQYQQVECELPQSKEKEEERT